MSTIFYSWQSDKPNSVNRGFIEDALEKAIKAANALLEVEAAERDEDELVRLDQDTRGISGSPKVAATILRKIEKCAMFVADLTIVATGEFARKVRQGEQIIEKQETRYCANPNVLLEYGYALAKLSEEQIIAVVNTAYGEASEQTLPFDLKYMRFPVSYHLPQDATPEQKAIVRKGLVAALTQQLRDAAKAGLFENQDPKEDRFPRVIAREGDPASFVGPMDPFHWSDGLPGISDRTGYLLQGQKAFLRLIPRKGTPGLPSALEAAELLQKGDLFPMSFHETHKLFGRNLLGGFVMDDPGQDTKRIGHLTQLFKSKELWGIDANILSKERTTKSFQTEFGVVQTIQIEKLFHRTLGRYLEFARNFLDLPAPVRVMVGLTGIGNYRLLLPQPNYVPGHLPIDGRCDEGHHFREFNVDPLTTSTTNLLQDFFESLWLVFGLRRPNMKPFLH